MVILFSFAVCNVHKCSVKFMDVGEAALFLSGAVAAAIFCPAGDILFNLISIKR